MNIVDGLFTGIIVNNYYLYNCIHCDSDNVTAPQPIRAVIIAVKCLLHCETLK